MARLRRGSAPADLRAVLAAAQEREMFGRWQEMLAPGTPFRPTARVLALEAGEPAEFHGHELCLLVPGLLVNGWYRVNPDGSVDEVDYTPREFPRAVRPTNPPAPPAREDTT